MKRLAVIGEPIEHSLSPTLFKEVFKQLGLDGEYQKIHVLPDELGPFVKDNDLDGFNVTIPHKETIIHFLDELDDHARAIRAVNCVVNTGDKLIGYNTDWIGFGKALKENGVSVKEKNCLVLGAGGAARAVVYALIQADACSIITANRTISKGAALVQWITNLTSINARSIPLKNVNTLTPEIVVNCTPMGMWPDIESVPLDSTFSPANQVMIDTIYNPLETAWLKAGRNTGVKTVGGLDMFIHQGLASADLWFGSLVSDKVDISQIFSTINNEL